MLASSIFSSTRPKMPLEIASKINELNVNNPTVSDGLNQGDDHLRLIKTALHGTFPNFDGTAPVSSTEAQLDAGAAVAQTGAAKLADSGAFFNTNGTDGFTNPAAGEVDVEAGGNVVAKLKSDKSVAFQGAVSAVGAVTATGPITGPGAVPVGGTMIWWSDTLPDASFGTYAWCNGATYPRSNTALWTILGTKYGSGDGSTTANLPDLRDNTPVGKGTMGGVGAAGRITNFVSTTLGAMWGECKHLLALGEVPQGQFTLTDPGHVHHLGQVLKQSTGNLTLAAGGNVGFPDQSTDANTTGITLTDHAGGGSHNNIQPSIVCNWIIRTA